MNELPSLVKLINHSNEFHESLNVLCGNLESNISYNGNYSDCDETAIFIVSCDLRIISRSSAAIRLIDRGIVRDGHFITQNSVFNACFRRWMTGQKCEPDRREFRRSLKVDPERYLNVYAHAINLANFGASIIFVVVIRDVERSMDHNIAAIKTRYGLTETEARVLAAVCQGLNTVSASRLMGIAKTTTRTHMQRVFAKTGTTSQAKLMQFVFRFMPGHEP